MFKIGQSNPYLLPYGKFTSSLNNSFVENLGGGSVPTISLVAPFGIIGRYGWW